MGKAMPSAVAALKQAVALEKSGDTVGALAAYDAILALHPDDPAAHEARLLLLADFHRYAEALTSAERLVVLQPTSPAAYNMLAYLQLCLGEPEKAIAAYDRATALNPKSPELIGDRAVALMKLKRFDEALTGLDRAIALNPKAAAFHNNRGNALKALARMEEALASYDRAIALAPSYADAHSNRGLVLNRLKRFEEAIASCNRALTLAPQSADAFNNRGLALHGLKRYPEALASYDQALALRPNFFGAHSNRGVTLCAMERFTEALASQQVALSLDATSAEAHCNLGLALDGLKQHAEALASFDRALALAPDLMSACEGRGHTLIKLRRYEEAVTAGLQAIALNPDSAYAHHVCGLAHLSLGNGDQALAYYDRAIALGIDSPDIHNDRAEVLVILRRTEEAHAAYDRAIAIKPNFAPAHWNKSLCHLLFGEFAEGWKLYEWRWKTEMFEPLYRHFTHPLWLGDVPLAGKTIFVYPEQGYGDFIQCLRYIPMLEDLGAAVLLETHGPMAPLIAPLGSRIRLISAGEIVPPFDLHCPVMSLPHACRTTLSTVPNQVPYLAAPPERIDHWRAQLGPKTRPRVGLVWSGSTGHGNDHNRSLTLAAIASIFDLPLEFHCLQQDIRAGDQPALAGIQNLHIYAEKLRDFADTAALIEQMDLVISVDTSVAHLAGALAKPVWVLLPFMPDYRWMLDREDSPWYPTARLFRQAQPRDWPAVVVRLREALASHLLPVHG